MLQQLEIKGKFKQFVKYKRGQAYEYLKLQAEAAKPYFPAGNLDSQVVGTFARKKFLLLRQNLQKKKRIFFLR